MCRIYSFEIVRKPVLTSIMTVQRHLQMTLTVSFLRAVSLKPINFIQPHRMRVMQRNTCALVLKHNEQLSPSRGVVDPCDLV